MGSDRLAVVDGLRAIAVIAVVLFHVFPRAVGGGFIGVDIFFAISGFVIALRYLDPLVVGEARFRDFFARRIRRLLPACFVVLVVTSAVAVAIMVPKDLSNYGVMLAAQAAFVQNVAFWQQGDYFDEPLLKPLLHTWSLAVEEQFYLLFPLMILAIRWKARIALPLMAAIFLVSIAIGLVGMRVSPPMTFYLLPFRAWEFMIGIIAAIVHRRLGREPASRPSRAVMTMVLLIGLAAIIASIVVFAEEAAFPGPQSLLALGGTMMVLLGQGYLSPSLYRLFAHPVIQHFGRISYSWYLWHWPVVSFHHLWFWREMTLAESVAALLLGYALGAASYHTIEKWGQASAWLRRPRNTIGLLVAFVVFALATGLAATQTRGLLDRYPARERALYAAQMDIPPYRCPISARLSLDGRQFCRINAVETGNGVLLLGDSHADLMKPVLADMASKAGRPLYFLIQNCRISDFGNKANCSRDDWRQLLRQIKARRVTDVIVISRFTKKFDAARFATSVADLSARGVRVTISLPTPESPMLDPGYWIRAGKASEWPQRLPIGREAALAANTEQTAAIRAVAARDPNVRLIDTTQRLCDGACRFAIGPDILYHDAHHLTSFGARHVAPLFQTSIMPPSARLSAQPPPESR